MIRFLAERAMLRALGKFVADDPAVAAARDRLRGTQVAQA
jgi:hypothetical protein